MTILPNLQITLESFRNTQKRKFWKIKGSNKFTETETTEVITWIMDINTTIRSHDRYLFLFKYNQYLYLFATDLEYLFPFKCDWSERIQINPVTHQYEPLQHYEVFSCFSTEAYNEYQSEIQKTTNKIHKRLTEKGIIVGVTHKLDHADFLKIIQTFLKMGYVRYCPYHNTMILYNPNQFTNETLVKFIGFRRREIHSEDAKAVNYRLQALKNETSHPTNSAQACKLIQCQPAQSLLKDIIEKYNLPYEYESLRPILIQLERYTHKRLITIIPRIMVGLVLFFGTTYTKVAIHRFCHAGNVLTIKLKQLFPQIKELRNMKGKQFKDEKQKMLTVLEKTT